MRMHGHRAARIDPLDLIHREEVAALSPERYGLVDDDRSYNVNGILWTKRVGESGEGEGEEWWTLKKIRNHLWSVYVGNIAYEVRCFYFQSLNQFFFSKKTSLCIPHRKRNVFGFLIFSNLKRFHLQKTHPSYMWTTRRNGIYMDF